jgi:hypothetical protein
MSKTTHPGGGNAGAQRSIDVRSSSVSLAPPHAAGNPAFAGSVEGFATLNGTDSHRGDQRTLDFIQSRVDELARLALAAQGPRAFECSQRSAAVHEAGHCISSIAFTWVKLRKNRRVLTSESDFHVSMGHTTRKTCEFCLIARRGSPRRLSGGVNELVIAPRREHSRKPDETYARIEQYCTGPYLELFARQTWLGWTAWGAEADKFDGHIWADDQVFREAAE